MIVMPRSMPEFYRLFGDEAACSTALHELRWGNGAQCPSCGNARREPVRPARVRKNDETGVLGKRSSVPDAAVARIEIPRKRKEARTEQPGLRDVLDSRLSLRGLDPPDAVSVESRL